MTLNTAALQSRRSQWPWFVLVTIVLLALLPALPDPYGGSEVLVAAVGGLWALAFYMHQRHAEDAAFLKELMNDFNARYNGMNDGLQSSVRNSGEFSEAQELKFIDYFNLCAEEWVFKEMGYVPPRIWEAWENGMRQYAQDKRVARLWERERASTSYYGFEFPLKTTES